MRKKRLSNTKTILSDKETGLKDETVDIVLLYDVLQMIRDKEALLRELHRILKAAGRLFVTAEHMEMREFTDVFDRAPVFSLVGQVGKLFRFEKA